MESNMISVIIIVFCVIMSAYFSATETAFSSLNRIRMKNKAEKGDKRAVLVIKLLDNYDGLLSTILIGNNIVNIACASLATLLFVQLVGQEAGASLSTIVTTIVVLIFGEISPKSIAKESPEAFALFSAPIINVLQKILTPANFLFKQWKKLLSRIFKTSGDNGITEEELLTIVDEAEQVGGIDEQEGTLIRSAIEFTDMEAIDIMTPRIDVTGVEQGKTKEEIAHTFMETGYSRLPVYEGSLDKIIGIIYQKDFYNIVYHTNKDVKDIIRPALFIAENKKIGTLLRELQVHKMHIAVILDEFGGTVGIVTLEDILEQLVGDIWDEHDEVVEEMVKISEDHYEVLGSANIDELFDELDIDQEFDCQTVSGWVMDVMDRIPAEGDTFTFRNLHVTVTKMADKRVDKVDIRIEHKEDQEKEQ
ncbi:MAG TPA: hemolysin family protein [Candidatus Hungatella pullicola]|nr:hemolysin family protein [Candidatus Hungatella pullicola]